jgi:hypothetical protein
MSEISKRLKKKQTIFAVWVLCGFAFCMYAKGQNEKNRVSAVEAVKVAKAKAKAKAKADAILAKANMKTVNCKQAKAMAAKVDANPYISWKSEYGEVELKINVRVAAVQPGNYRDITNIIFKCGGNNFAVRLDDSVWGNKRYREVMKLLNKYLKYEDSAKTSGQLYTAKLAKARIARIKTMRKFKHIKKGHRIKVRAIIGGDTTLGKGFTIVTMGSDTRMFVNGISIPRVY